ncbi:hypothetical protein E4T39_05423 [Aureobasidium subglaciale]|nr:hypothetical protein E4T39_05423 [Aureobasidium subglaciale]
MSIDSNSIDRDRRKQEQMIDVFITKDSRPGDSMEDSDVGDYISPEQLKQWEEKGFQKVVCKDWSKEPTAEEQRRMTKMTSGADLRNYL